MSARNLPSTVRKLVALRSSKNFREVTKVVTEPIAKPGIGQLLVRNRYLGINASDINFTAGYYDPKAKYPLDVGFEAVGEVVSAGPDTPYKPGQALMYLEYGAFADYKVVKSSSVVPIPQIKAEYLPLVLSGNTATISLDKVGEIKSGETVLVTAAAGGTGQIAVQWAKLHGCHVIGTCSTDDKVKFLKEIGCDRPINYKTENIRDVLKSEYPKGVDVVYETIGGDMFDACVDGLGVKGRLIIIGYVGSYQTEKGYDPARSLATLPSKLLSKSGSVRAFFLYNYFNHFLEYTTRMAEYYKDGKLKLFVDNGEKCDTGPFIGLEKIPDAVDYLYSQKSIGKIVVDLEPNKARL